MGLLGLAGVAAATTVQELPKGARAGECFSRTTSAPTYRTDKIAVPQLPLVTWRDIAPVYKTVSKQVLVTPGRVDRQLIPAVTGTRMHWVEHPGADRVVETPPVYRWVEKRVVISPGHLEWRPGTSKHGYGEGGGYGEAVSVRPTGEVMCRVWVAPRYEIRRVRVLATPGRSCIVKGPSSRERVVEHFVVTPAHTIEHPIAPVYRTVTERVLVSPGRKERVVTPQPARYVEKKVLVAPGRPGWTKIACAPPKPRPVPRGYGASRGYIAPAPSYGKPYTPDYAQPRPVGELYGAPTQPSYARPRPSE